jgi:hypothetical protein
MKIFIFFMIGVGPGLGASLAKRYIFHLYDPMDIHI